MNQEVKKLWIKELRSGKYKQGTGFLKQGDEFCCLGVLCDMWSKENSQHKFIEHDDGVSTILSREDTLPDDIFQWAGLDDCNPTVKSGFCLAQINDIGFSFLEIADLIEEEL